MVEHFLGERKGLPTINILLLKLYCKEQKRKQSKSSTPQFLKDFSNWKALAKANKKKLERYLKPIGLYRQRTIRLLSLSDEMVKRNGRLPRKREELEAIPFMGQYIANAVELIIFNQPKPLVDVNMARVLERFFGPRKMADIRYDNYLQGLS